MAAPNPNIIKAPQEIRSFWKNNIARGDAHNIAASMGLTDGPVSVIIRTGRATVEQIEQVTNYLINKPRVDPRLSELIKKIEAFESTPKIFQSQKKISTKTLLKMSLGESIKVDQSQNAACNVVSAFKKNHSGFTFKTRKIETGTLIERVA